MLSRLALGALALSGALLGVAKADPATYCAPVTIDIFSVTASANGDVEGSEIVQAMGNDAPVYYYVPLASNYSSRNVFFNIELTPNVTSKNYNGLQSYGFSIELNDVFATNSSGAVFFEAPEDGTVANIEFTNWKSARTAALNNTLILNVTEFIEIGQAPNTHITQCDYLYYFTFNNPAGIPGTGANIVGDPQFVGLRGQSYQVHGIDGAVYNIISEKELQVNSRFVFLNEGACPAESTTNCWSHPGSYLGEISYQAIVDGKLHAALVQAGPAKKGFAGVQVDGKSVAVGDKVEFGSFSLERTSAYEVIVNTEHFSFVLSNSDNFVNQAIRALVPLSELSSTHGLLGQTHSSKTYASAIKHIAGDVDDYVIADSDIFGTDFSYNQFQA